MRAIFTAAIAAWSFSASAAEWPPVTEYVNSATECAAQANASNCDYTKQAWPNDYKKAKKGDYQGQRNVAFCLSTGCDGAIRQNKILGCAWRFVILESGHLSADSTDTTNLKYYCGSEHVDKAGRATAEAQARRILKMIRQ